MTKFTELKMAFLALVNKIKTHQLVKNVAYLWILQAFRKLLPLVLMPFLARQLGPEGWGLAAVFLSFGAVISQLINYGFELSGIRDVARVHNNYAKLGRVVSRVGSAQLVLSIPIFVIAVSLHSLVPLFNQYPALFAASLLYALLEGINPTWFFMGIERMDVAAGLEILSKTSTAVAMLLLIRSTDDVLLFVLLETTTKLILVLLGFYLISKEVSLRFPRVKHILATLKRGWSLFLVASSGALYTTVNAFLLGLFVTPAVVGYYAGAEKIIRAVAGLYEPVRQTLYSRMSKLTHVSPEKAARLLTIATFIEGIGAVLATILLYVFGPNLLGILLGSEFASALPILHVLSLLLPIIAISQLFGHSWLLTSGQERLLARITLFGGIANLIMVVILVPFFGGTGMAWSIVFAEGIASASCIYWAMINSPNRFQFSISRTGQ